MEKQVYVAPKAEFVPLKPEERLMACGKVGEPVQGGCATGGRATIGAAS